MSWTIRPSVSGDQIFFSILKCPYRFWGPTALLFTTDSGFFLVELEPPGREFDRSVHLELRLRTGGATFLLPLYATMQGTGRCVPSCNFHCTNAK